MRPLGGQGNFHALHGIPNEVYRELFLHGAVAQLVEHHVRNVGVESSSLFRSTNPQGLVFPRNRYRFHSSASLAFYYPQVAPKRRISPLI